MQPFIAQSIVLKVQLFREADTIATFLTPSHGRVSAIARSARNSKKRFVGGIDVFDCGTAELAEAKNKSALFYCNSFQREVFWLSLRKSLLKLSLGSLAAELLLQLSTDNDQHSKELFNPAAQFFQSLDTTQNTNAAFSGLVKLLLETLTISGYSPLACAHLFPCEVIPWWEQLMSAEVIPAPQYRETIYHSTTRLIQYSEKITERQLISREGVLSAARAVLLGGPAKALVPASVAN